MDEKTLTALKGSIAHWEDVVAEPTTQVGAKNCPLCTLFNYIGNDCGGCPVMDATKQPFCAATPYYDFVNTRTNPRYARKFAQKELDFLKSLLPDETSDTAA